MAANNPSILALDFDGVVCDGLIEYFETAWRTYCQIWSPIDSKPPDDLAPQFYQLRPVIETGWEMPVLIRALVLGISEDRIWLEWGAIAQQLLQQANLSAADVGKRLDRVRDEWISTDLNGWLSLHRFYPGVVERLRSLIDSPVQPIIITTKEGRFVSQLLQQQGVNLPEQSIFGKECKQPKHQIIRKLIDVTSESFSLWFVEDRLKTLHLVQQQADLESVRLYLADWGYNTAIERETADHHPRIRLLSLSEFVKDFSAWA